MDNGTRDELLGRLAEVVGSIRLGHPTRVAVDGPPAAGKTCLADELAVLLRGQGRDVIRASIEEFLLPRLVRYRRGEDSPEGCYEDSFDFDALHRVLLDPLGPGGDRRFQVAVYDKRTDSAVAQPANEAAVDAVLLFDGVFLMRPDLLDGWDVRIFVSASFTETVARVRTRDVDEHTSASEVERRYRARYIPSQQRYFDSIQPTQLADFIVHNDELQHPRWEIPIH